jgi:hypothetical protein
MNILSLNPGLRDELQRILDLMIGFIGTSSQLQTITLLSLIYPLHKSLGHAPFSSLYSQLTDC